MNFAEKESDYFTFTGVDKAWGSGALVANFDNNANVQSTPGFAERFYNGDAPLTTEEGVSVSYENLKLRATNMRAIGIDPDETLKAIQECLSLS